jgi:alkylhydroperoxidase family enzyme
LINETEGRPATLDALTRLVLKGAREVTIAGKMAADTFAALQTHMPNEQLVDLIVSIAFYNAVVRVLASLEIDVEPEYQRYLERWPLPVG